MNPLLELTPLTLSQVALSVLDDDNEAWRNLFGNEILRSFYHCCEPVDGFYKMRGGRGNPISIDTSLLTKQHT